MGGRRVPRYARHYSRSRAGSHSRRRDARSRESRTRHCRSRHPLRSHVGTVDYRYVRGSGLYQPEEPAESIRREVGEELMRIRNIALVLGIAFLSATLWAHHGSAVSYDLSQRVTMKGTITDFKYINP